MVSLLFILIPLSFIVNVSSYDTFKCLNSSFIEDPNICMLYKKDEKMYYIRSCPNKMKCNSKQLQDNDGIYTCNNYFTTKMLGEKCTVDIECYSKNCTKGICSAKSIGDSCVDTYECEGSSFCQNGVCHSYLKENEICTDHNERCPYGYICAQPYAGAEDRVCIKQHSIKSGNFAATANLCESGLYDMNTCYDTKLPSGEKPFKECNSDEDCVVIKIFNGAETNIKGSCSSGREGKMRCGVVSTSNEWKEYIRVFRKVVQETEFPLNIGNTLKERNQELQMAYLNTEIGYYLEDTCARNALIQRDFGFDLSASFWKRSLMWYSMCLIIILLL